MSGFKMYITTKLGNPSYTPEVRDFVTTFEYLLYCVLKKVKGLCSRGFGQRVSLPYRQAKWQQLYHLFWNSLKSYVGNFANINSLRSDDT